MNALIREVLWTFKLYGAKESIERIYNYAIFKLKRMLQRPDVENYKKFQTLQGKYAGKRIFILGNGPSLNHMPLYLLKDEYKMCFNYFPLMVERINWYPDFFAVTDSLVIQDQAQEINTSIVPKVKYAFFPDLHTSNLNVKKIIHKANNVLWLHVDKMEFSDKMPNCGMNKTVVNAGIQIAAYLGFTEIYILGVDLTYTNHDVKKESNRNWISNSDDPNHFDPRYFGRGKRYHNFGDMQEMKDKFDLCRKFFEPRGVKIFNAGYGGNLESFPRINFEEVLNISNERQKDLFLNAIHAINPNITLSDFKVFQDEDCNYNFKIPTEKGIKLIKEYIFTHIPFGPFQGYYYFLKR